MAKLTVNYPNVPKGVDMLIPKLGGTFANGDVYDVDNLEDDLVLGEPLVKTGKKSTTDPKDGE